MKSRRGFLVGILTLAFAAAGQESKTVAITEPANTTSWSRRTRACSTGRKSANTAITESGSVQIG